MSTDTAPDAANPIGTTPPRSPGAPATRTTPAGQPAPDAPAAGGRPRETGGPAGPEPTRYGDWEVRGRCSDF